jgi:hypothetical protein
MGISIAPGWGRPVLMSVATRNSASAMSSVRRTLSTRRHTDRSMGTCCSASCRALVISSRPPPKNSAAAKAPATSSSFAGRRAGRVCPGVNWSNIDGILVEPVV